MKRISAFCIFFIFVIFSLSAQTPAEIKTGSGGVEICTQQGNYVFATNVNDFPCYFSYNYIISGYNKANFLVIQEESSSEDNYIEAKERNELFTAPDDDGIKYIITITSVYNVRSAKEEHTSR